MAKPCLSFSSPVNAVKYPTFMTVRWSAILRTHLTPGISNTATESNCKMIKGHRFMAPLAGADQRDT